LPIQIFYYLFNKIERKKIWGLDGKGINLNFILSNSTVISSIPLLYHIFIGDISFVGSQFIDIKKPNPQHILKPGLTSLVNVEKFKGNDCQRINNYYIRNQSLTFDIEIILKSLFRI